MKYTHLKNPLLCSLFLAGLTLLLNACQQDAPKEIIEIFHTTDIHGNILSEDFLNGGDSKGGLPFVQSYVGAYRKNNSNVLLLDAGDLLQGQPTTYYYNFIDTLSKHIAADALNFMQYDAMAIGNHDIETGHSVYDRFTKEVSFPILGANVIDISNDATSLKPYFKPYTFLKKGSRKIAVLGLTMPTLVHNLPARLWQGLRFDDQIETAKRYIPEIKQQNPDLIIVLMHSGRGATQEPTKRLETNVGYDLAKSIPEVDLVLCGHDHEQYIDSVFVQGKERPIYIVNPGALGFAMSHTQAIFTSTPDGKTELRLTPKIVDLKNYTADPSFVHHFISQTAKVKEFVSQHITNLSTTLDSRSSFFRPCPFMDLIHELQLHLYPKADISITAPLEEDTKIPSGELRMSDLFKLYKYENTACLMRMTGKEVKGHLEESYNRLYHSMKKPSDPLIKINEKKRGGLYLPLEGVSFNFDTAAGIEYTIDLRKPEGDRISILTMKNGKVFHPDSIYYVVMNSYRANGGGALLTLGAGIPFGELKSRQVESTENDLRYYLRAYLLESEVYQPQSISNWRIIPEEWAEIAIPRDSATLFKER